MPKVFVGVILAIFLILHSFGSLSLALNEKDSLPLSHYIMAQYYDNIGELDKAVKENKKALSLDPDNCLAHFNLAVVLLKKKDAKGARKELAQAVKINPQAKEPHALLAILELMEGSFDSAVQEYEKALKGALELDPKDIEVYKNLGALHLRRGNLREAENSYRLVTELDPYDPEGYFFLGVIYSELKENDLLENNLRKAISLKPDFAPALNFLGYTYVEEARNYREAEGLIKKALKVEPDNGAYLDSLGWLYYKKGRVKEARDILNRAISLLPDPVIYDHLGDIYFRLRDLKNAAINWQESLRLDPAQEMVREKFKRLAR